jgi:hypothetical protein
MLNLVLAVVLSSYPVPNECIDLPASSLINGDTLASSRSFSIDRPNEKGGYSVLALSVALVNSGSTVTRLDTTCTVSLDGNVTDLIPQSWSEAAGVFTGTGSGIFRVPISGTSYAYPIRLNLNAFPDFECTFSVGAGSGDSSDLLTVQARLCTE